MKLTKETLIDWIDRPPSNSDLDFINKIIELEKRVEQYENPDDYTLFYMWLDTRAKDKMKQLEKENERLKEILKWKQNREAELFTIESVLGTNKQLYDERNIYKSRCEKAIEYLKSYNTDFEHCRFNEAPISLRELGNLLNILQNGSDSNDPN